MEKSYLLYLVAFFFCSLSVYNFLINLENNSRLEEIRRDKDAGDGQGRYRQRRHVENDDDWRLINIDRLNSVIDERVNKTLKGELKKVLNELLKDEFYKDGFCHNIEKCKQGAPVISLQKGPVFVTQGINYQFPECKVRSFPKAKITWKRVFLPLPKDRHYTKDGVLNISQVRYEDEGFYICEAENIYGKAVQKIQLKTNGLEMYEKPPASIQGLKRIHVINCSAYGSPDEMTGQIMRIDGPKETPIKFLVQKSENLFRMQAVIKKSGTYSCVIKYNAEEIKALTNVEFFNLYNSRILTDTKDIQQLGEWLQEYSAPLGKYIRCYYRYLRYGSSHPFHEKCGGKSNTITLVKYFVGKRPHRYYRIAGAYAGPPWVKPTNGTKISDSTNTFLFDLTSGDKFDAKPGNSTKMCYKRYYPCFGNNEMHVTCCTLSLYWHSTNSTSSFNMGAMNKTISWNAGTIEVFYKL